VSSVGRGTGPRAAVISDGTQELMKDNRREEQKGPAPETTFFLFAITGVQKKGRITEGIFLS